jgi:hypothetical protein
VDRREGKLWRPGSCGQPIGEQQQVAQGLASSLQRGSDPGRGGLGAVGRSAAPALKGIEQQASQNGSWLPAGGKLRQQLTGRAVG